MTPDLVRVAGIIRDAAAAEILPRFGRLAADEVREKGPGDLVTVADLAAERRLTAALEELLPGSVSLGEEAVAADPTRLDRLAGAAPVWVIDPIDGTGNFARGRPGFAVIVAYVEGGATTAGWIYDPLGDVMAWTSRGDGAWSAGRRLDLAAAAPRPLTGSAYGRTAGGVRTADALRASGLVAAVNNRGCSGLEYLEVALGAAQFTLHSRALPWDHAAGMLITAEAGGAARFLDGSPYDPRIRDAAPLAAASADVWRLVQGVATAPTAAAKEG